MKINLQIRILYFLKSQIIKAGRESTYTCTKESEIKKRIQELKTEKKTKKIYPMVVFGDTSTGEKEFYVAYMDEPSFPQVSKFMPSSQKDEY